MLGNSDISGVSSTVTGAIDTLNTNKSPTGHNHDDIYERKYHMEYQYGTYWTTVWSSVTYFHYTRHGNLVVVTYAIRPYTPTSIAAQEYLDVSLIPSWANPPRNITFTRPVGDGTSGVRAPIVSIIFHADTDRVQIFKYDTFEWSYDLYDTVTYYTNK